MEFYDEQSDAYKEQVLPNAVCKRILVEAAEAFGWHRFIGLDGDSITMNRFGACAPGGTCMEKFGFTVDNVVAKSTALLGWSLEITIGPDKAIAFQAFRKEGFSFGLVHHPKAISTMG